MFLNMPPQIIVFLVSLFPIGERAVIPLAMKVYGLSALEALIISILGAILPVAFVVFLLGPISSFLSKYSKAIKNFFDWLFRHTQKKHGRQFELFKGLALLIFVSIPSPITGPWGGALASFVFGIPPKKALPLIFGGVLISGIIIIFLTEGVSIIFR